MRNHINADEVVLEEDDEPDVPDGMKRYVLSDSKGPNVEFVGRLLGSYSSHREGSYHWTELDAYVTRGDHWIVHQRTMDTREGYETRNSAHIFKTKESMFRGLGYKRIYASLWRAIGLESIVVD